MKIISIKKAVGKKLSHDISRIVSEKKIKKIWKKGYKIKKEDIECFKNNGKYDIILLENNNNNKIHENEGSKIIAKSGINNFCEILKTIEGKTFIISKKDGHLKLDINRLKKINLIDGITISSKKNNIAVKNRKVIAVFGITPLEIEIPVLKKALKLLKTPIISVKPFIDQKIGLITTGTEIYEGRIKDAFLKYLSNSLKIFNFKVKKQIILPDQINLVKKTILKMIKENFNIILLSGGMSVDANDITLEAVKNISNIKIISYGSPVLPGAMILISYFNSIPIIGLPAGILKSKLTIFDFILPFILSKQKITRNYIASLSDGGLL